MTDRYCDAAQDFANPANVGDATGNPALGPGGWQSMIEGWGNHDALAAGDDLHVKGTGDESKLVKITVDVDKSAAWAIGDVVENHNDGGGANGDDWIGVLVFIDATTVWAQINAASSDIDSVDTADGVYNVTRTDEIAGANMSAATAPGIVYDNNSGTSAAAITTIGVNDAWVEDGTRAILDAKDKATYNVSTAGQDYLHFRNIHGKDSASHGWIGFGSGSTYCHFENCIAEGSGGNGFGSGGSGSYATLHRCKAYDWSGTYGFFLVAAQLHHCTAYNGTAGFWGRFCSFSGCVAFECTTGFVENYTISLYNCVADANTTGVSCLQGAGQLVGCRITNNTTGVGGSKVFHDPYTFYGGNTANWTADLGVDLVDGESTRTISDVAADIGYIDGDNATLADRNYGLTNQAAARRQAVTL